MALGEGQEMTLTFNTHIPSLSQLVVDASTKSRWKNDPAKVKKIYIRPKKWSGQSNVRPKKWSGHGRTGRSADDGLVNQHYSAMLYVSFFIIKFCTIASRHFVTLH